MPEPTTPSKPATIREVAARAGVSTATVSRSLRGGVGVEPATRAKVEAAARELRYRPSGVARSLKMGATKTLGLIVTDIENPYFPQIVRAVEDAALEQGYTVLLADGRRDPERELESLDILGEHEVDGMIIASTTLTRRHGERIRELPCPVIIMNSDSTVPDVPAVMSDNYSGGRLAAEHILRLGHRTIAFVGGPEGEISVQARVDGVRAAVTEHMAVDGDQFRVVDADASFDGGVRAAETLVAGGIRETALLCRNDLTAIGVLRGLKAAGVRVPQDVSVVGFDDIEMSAYVDPALTTVHQSTDEMARRAVADLFERVSRGREEVSVAVVHPPGETYLVPVELVVRASSGPPPA